MDSPLLFALDSRLSKERVNAGIVFLNKTSLIRFFDWHLCVFNLRGDATEGVFPARDVEEDIA